MRPGSEAYGWLPPPLIGEGNKVQTAWLHDFLLDPYPIRPAVFLRMPKFNMSSAEATALANYFAAVDNADFPYVAAAEHAAGVASWPQRKPAPIASRLRSRRACQRGRSLVAAVRPLRRTCSGWTTR